MREQVDPGREGGVGLAGPSVWAATGSIRSWAAATIAARVAVSSTGPAAELSVTLITDAPPAACRATAPAASPGEPTAQALPAGAQACRLG